MDQAVADSLKDALGQLIARVPQQQKDEAVLLLHAQLEEMRVKQAIEGNEGEAEAE